MYTGDSLVHVEGRPKTGKSRDQINPRIMWLISGQYFGFGRSINDANAISQPLNPGTGNKYRALGRVGSFSF